MILLVGGFGNTLEYMQIFIKNIQRVHHDRVVFIPMQIQHGMFINRCVVQNFIKRNFLLLRHIFCFSCSCQMVHHVCQKVQFPLRHVTFIEPQNNLDVLTRDMMLSTCESLEPFKDRSISITDWHILFDNGYIAQMLWRLFKIYTMFSKSDSVHAVEKVNKEIAKHRKNEVRDFIQDVLHMCPLWIYHSDYRALRVIYGRNSQYARHARMMQSHATANVCFIEGGTHHLLGDHLLALRCALLGRD